MGGPTGPGQAGKDKDDGPAEEAPKDKQALQPIEPIPAQPKPRRRVQLFELEGYMRMRADYFHRLDLGLGPAEQPVTEDTKFFRPPAQTDEPNVDTDGDRPNDVHCGEVLVENGVNDPNKLARRCQRRNGFASANMRLRLEPTLHITDSVMVHTTIDALDNLVLGSTPDSFVGENPWAPIDLYTRTQYPPSAGINSFQDSLTVKRAYGHIRFGWGLDLKFGRMPQHWGLGIVYNDGNGYDRNDRGDIVRMLDHDYGDSVDSLKLSFDFGKDRRRAHTVGISWDWAASGPTTSQLLGPTYASGNRVGQDFSAEKFDNVYQASAFILRRDDPSMLRRKLSLGVPVVNYGAIAWMRLQYLDRAIGSPGLGDGLGDNPDVDTDGLHKQGSTLGNGQLDGEGESGLNNYANLLVYRRAFVLTPDVWLRVNWRTLRVELEAGAHLGWLNHRNLSDTTIDENLEAQTIGGMQRESFQSFGYALEFKYGFFDDRFHIGLDQGYAMGDQAPSENFDSTSPYLSTENGISVGGNTFRFNPSYTQDLLLFRELMGTVANAAYFRPWAAFYFFHGNASGRLDIQYALAHQPTATPGNRYSYGIEIDGAIRYHDVREPIFVQLQYGVMFPLRAFDRFLGSGNTDAKAAQTVQAQIGIKF